jgi:hypothetical protein
MHQVVAADREAVAVARDHPDVEVGIGELDTGRDGRGPAVDGVEAIGFDVVGKARGTADPRDEDRVVGVGPELGQRLLHGLEDRVVAAAGAPADLLVGGPVLGSRLFWRAVEDGGHRLSSARG